METIPLSGIVLAGGATHNDDAMIWMLQRAAAGDVLVIRASGEDGCNDYFFSDLGVEVNSNGESNIFSESTPADCDTVTILTESEENSIFCLYKSGK
ncbi:MAG TPA: hypothetical protein VFM99_03075 [Chitinophagales bacterium]|nr:hypothetical protein [Chitinophagales bacterium]